MLVTYVHIAFVVIVVCKYTIDTYNYNRVDVITIKGRFDHLYKLYE